VGKIPNKLKNKLIGKIPNNLPLLISWRPATDKKKDADWLATIVRFGGKSGVLLVWRAAVYEMTASVQDK
jgi:hypothetical protein